MVKNKLCPYRKWMQAVGEGDEFRLCLQDECAMWREKETPVVVQSGMTNAMVSEGSKKVGYCGLAGEIGGLVS